MAHPVSLLNAQSEFDSFLFAPIGEDRKGTVVSVLSAFARLGFDPWQQAADIARLPREVAKTKLAAMIATLPGMSSSPAEPAVVASRLVALLPDPARPLAASRDAWLGADQPVDRLSPRFILLIVLLMVMGLAAQFFVASQQPSDSADAGAPQASDSAGPQGQQSPALPGTSQ
jgi:hypothetical protein